MGPLEVPGLVVVCCLLGAFAPPGVYRGRRFELVDPQGRVRAELAVIQLAGMTKEQPVLRLWDEKGGLRVLLGLIELPGMSEQGPVLSLFGEDGAERVRVFAGKTLAHVMRGKFFSEGSLVVFNALGQPEWAAP